MRSGYRWMGLLGFLGFLPAIDAAAAPICSAIPQSPPSYAARIAAAGCNENTLWYGPFIDDKGRLARARVFESEHLRLNDGATPAWQRVADYWKGSGLLWQVAGRPGASDCA